MPDKKQITYVIEHMESEFSDWVKLEYLSIIEEVGKDNLIISSVPADVEEKDLPKEFVENGLNWTHTDIVNFKKLYPNFEKSKVCLLDPSATEELVPEDADKFDFFLFGGILGDHPPRDRTGELRKHGFPGRHLGSVQMTTDSAVRVSQIVLKDGKKLNEIPYIDFPELKFNKHESTEMPFRYVKGEDNKPVMPKGMFELIKEDTNKSLF